MSHQQSFSYKGTGLPGLKQYYARINVLAQGHNAVTPVRLEPTAPRSQNRQQHPCPPIIIIMVDVVFVVATEIVV